MKSISLFLFVFFIFSSLSFAFSTEERVRRAEAFQICVEDCTSFSEPGWELRSCLEECKAKYIIHEIIQPLYCNTYEEDCERDNDGGAI